MSQDTWDMCRKRMSNANGNAANRAKHDYMLSRMLICKKCGKPMIGVCCDGRLYYACRTKGCKWWRKEELEERVQHELSSKLRPTPEIRAKFYDMVKARVNTRSKVIEVNKANLELDKRIRKILTSIQYADEEMIPVLMAQAKELKAKKLPVPKEREVSKEACDNFINSFFDFSDKDYETRKLIIRKVLCKIIVGDELYLSTNISGEVYQFVLR